LRLPTLSKKRTRKLRSETLQTAQPLTVRKKARRRLIGQGGLSAGALMLSKCVSRQARESCRLNRCPRLSASQIAGTTTPVPRGEGSSRRSTKWRNNRRLAFEIATNALQLFQNGRVGAPPLEQWSDIEKADKMARRSAGLDSNESAAKVNVALNLVNQRILAMQEDTDQDR
jgi:hypothetical protein